MKNLSPGTAGSGGAPASISDQVRLVIISVGGLAGATPADLGDNDDLANDFQFDAGKFALLAVRLQQLVQDAGSAGQLTSAAVNNCKTVKDVVTLVTKTITP